MPDFENALLSISQKRKVRIEYFEEISSTNDAAQNGTFQHGDVVIADRQLKGRGQRGNSWSSRSGENLTLSVVLRPERFPAEKQFYISKIISLALVDALRSYGVEAEIKWPNDIYIGHRKVAGILIENDLMGAEITRSIAGIGLNVNQELFDPGLPNPTSMKLEVGRVFERERVLDVFLGEAFRWYGLLNEGDFSMIDETYARSLYRREGSHLFKEPGAGSPFLAQILEVKPGGELVLENENGDRKSYLFKEVEFILKKSE